MRLETFRHDGRAFTTPWLPALDSEQTLVLAFAGAQRRADVDPRSGPMRELRRAYPRSHFLVGAAGDGDELEVAVACFEWTLLRTAIVELDRSRLRRDELHSAGAELARKLAGPGLRGVLLLAETGRSGGRELADGLDGALPPRVAATGLVTQCAGGSTAAIAAIGLYGDELHFQVGQVGQVAPLVTTIGEGGRTLGDGWGERLAIVAGRTSGPAKEPSLDAPTITLLADTAFSRAARADLPASAASLDRGWML